MKPAYVTQQLAEFIYEFEASKIDTETFLAAERAILDIVAAIIGGVPTQNAQNIRKAALAIFGHGKVIPLFTQGQALNFHGSLWANCAAASILDIDDGHRGAAGHAGAAIVPAILMEAMRLNSDAESLLTAVILGYDISLRIASARIFTADISFASGRWTGYGVAASIAWLRGLPADKIANAMAIAGAEAPQNLPQGACMTSSIKGSSPWATVTAFAAVEQASLGAKGSIDLLDRETIFDIPAITAKLGKRFKINQLYFKPYASCRYTHSMMDAIFEIKSEPDFKVEQIEMVTVEAFFEASKIPNNVAPQSIEDAQFSIPFTAALALLRGKSAFRPLIPAVLSDEKILTLSKLIELRHPSEFKGKFPINMPTRVTISGKNWRLSKYVESPLGDVSNPLSTKEIEQKLFDLGATYLPQSLMNDLIHSIKQLRYGNSKILFSALA